MLTFKFKRTLFLVVWVLLSGILSLAGEINPIIGKWRWAASDCKNPDLSFEAYQIKMVTQVDGSNSVHVFKKINYLENANEIIVDFGEPHGFGKSPEPTKLSFKIINKDKMEMIRKTKSMNEVVRCR